MLGGTHATYHMNLPNISSNDFSQTQCNPHSPFTNAPTTLSRDLPQRCCLHPLRGQVTNFLGGWEKLICFETGKGRIFFCWKGPPHWFLSLKNSDQKICATQMIQTQMMNRLAALADDSPTGSIRSTPLNFRLPWLPKGTGARSDLIFCSSEKLLGWFFLIFRNNVTNSKDRGFILVRLGGRVLSFQGQSFLMRSVVLKFHIDDKHLDVIFVCF